MGVKLTHNDGCAILRITGDQKNSEKAETIIKFPTGEVSITRTSDNKYWVHFHIRKDEIDQPMSRLVNARLDITGKHTNENDIGDFGDPNLYHLAVLTELI